MRPQPQLIYPGRSMVVDHKGYSVWLNIYRTDKGVDLYVTNSLN